MTDSVIRLVRGDTGPDTTLYLTDHATGNPIDLTNVTSIALRIRAKGSTTVLQTLAPTVQGTPTLGQVLVQWSAASLLNPEGWYEAELELTLAGPKTVTVYRTLRIKLREQF